MERWTRIGVAVTAVLMIGILGFSTWSAATDPRRTDAVAGVTTVDVYDNGFAPFVIEVETGTEVTFDFVGADVHDVSFDDGAGSPQMASGTFERAFTEPGVYDFICTIHPLSMRGSVLVVDG